MKQVQDLVSIEPVNEWSGILVYEAQGSITNVDELVVIPKYIKLMDIGTKSYTEYDFGAMAIEVFDEYPDALKTSKFKLGHIHSHNTMGVFFSGTDMDELTSNSPHHFMYLSVIVNNRLDVDCKIGLYCEQDVSVSESFTYSITDIDGKTIPFKGNNKSKKVIKSCITYDCDIVFPEMSRSEYFNVFVNNYNRIKAEKEEKLKAAKAVAQTYNQNAAHSFVPHTTLNKDKTSPASHTLYPPIKSNGKMSGKSYSALTTYQIEKFEKIFQDMFIQVDEDTGNYLSEKQSIEMLSMIYLKLNPTQKTNVVDTFTGKFYNEFVDIGISEEQTFALISKLCGRLSQYRTFDFINAISEDLGML